MWQNMEMLILNTYIKIQTRDTVKNTGQLLENLINKYF